MRTWTDYRWHASILALALLLQGCSSPAPEGKTALPGEQGASEAARKKKPESPREKPLPPGAPSAPRNAKEADESKYPLIVPVDRNQGRVAKVNERLRFVVVDYALSPMPKIGQHVYLYHEGTKTAELRIAGPSMGTTIIADLLQGEAKIGDVARED